MTDPLALFRAGVAEFGARVHRVRGEQWTASTPCSARAIGALDPPDGATEQERLIALAGRSPR